MTCVIVREKTAVNIQVYTVLPVNLAVIRDSPPDRVIREFMFFQHVLANITCGNIDCNEFVI